MGKRLKTGYGSLKKPLYLNANIIFSVAYCTIHKKNHSTLSKLRESGYRLVTSIITRYEVVKNLTKDIRTKLNPTQARNLYFKILNDEEIMEITALHNLNILTDDFLERMINAKITFKDGLHLETARRYKEVPVCTHDKHMKEGSTHEAKKKFYRKVHKPSELILPKIKRLKK